MLDENKRKELVTEYFRRVNEGDVDGVLELLSQDAVIEDPVGHPPKTQRETLREYFNYNLKVAQLHDTVGTLVAGQDDRHVAAPLTANLIDLLDPGKRQVAINAVVTFEINDSGLIKKIQAFWGMTDIVS